MRKVFFLIFEIFDTPLMHFARFKGSGRLENHIKINFKLLQNHVEKELRFHSIFVDFGIILGFQGRPFWAQNLKKMHPQFDCNFNDFLIPSGERNAGGSEPARGPF